MNDRKSKPKPRPKPYFMPSVATCFLVFALPGCIAPKHDFEFDTTTGKVAFSSQWEESQADWEGEIVKQDGTKVRLKVTRGTDIAKAAAARALETQALTALAGKTLDAAQNIAKGFVPSIPSSPPASQPAPSNP